MSLPVGEPPSPPIQPVPEAGIHCGQDNKHHRGYWDKYSHSVQGCPAAARFKLNVASCDPRWRRDAEWVRLNLQQLLNRLFQSQQLGTFQA